MLHTIHGGTMKTRTMSRTTSRTIAFLLASSLAFATISGSVVAAEVAKPKVVTAAKVNINTADAETIADLLVGVGLSKAKAIVKYREEHGRFASVDQLKDVKGIGQALINSNKERMALE